MSKNKRLEVSIEKLREDLAGLDSLLRVMAYRNDPEQRAKMKATDKEIADLIAQYHGQLAATIAKLHCAEVTIAINGLVDEYDGLYADTVKNLGITNDTGSG